jgi:DNA-binding transcriptional MerR regulator
MPKKIKSIGQLKKQSKLDKKDLARALAIKYTTLSHYIKLGLILPVQSSKLKSKLKLYSLKKTQSKLKRIKYYQEQGFRLLEIISKLDQKAT